MKRNSFIYMLLLIIMLLACAPKPFLWHGHYININTTEQPKEDFVVGSYVVISYAPCEYKKGISRLYKFALIQNGKQVGFITLDKHELIMPVYYLEESNVRHSGHFSAVSSVGDHVTYNMYKNFPSYERVKADVITLLHGGELIPESLDK